MYVRATSSDEDFSRHDFPLLVVLYPVVSGLLPVLLVFFPWEGCSSLYGVLSGEFVKFTFVVNFSTSLCVFVAEIALYYMRRETLVCSRAEGFLYLVI